MESNLVLPPSENTCHSNKVGVGEFSMYIGLGTNRKERG